jgi:hypothetical protein
LFSGYGNLNSLNSQLASYLFGVNSNLTSNLNQTNTGLYNTLMSSNSGLAGGTASNNTALANTGAQLAQKAGDADAAMYNTIGGSLATAVGKQPAGTFSNMFSGTGSNGWGASTVPTSSLA